jgi:hypothetical protein
MERFHSHPKSCAFLAHCCMSSVGLLLAFLLMLFVR